DPGRAGRCQHFPAFFSALGGYAAGPLRPRALLAGIPVSRRLVMTSTLAGMVRAFASSRALRSRFAQAGRYGARVALPRPAHPERVAIVAVVVLAVVNLAYLGTRNEVRGTASLELPAPIVGTDPQQGENILPQASITV